MKKAKALSIFIAALAFCGLFAFAKVDVSAAAMLPEEMAIAYMSTDYTSVSIQVTQGEAYTEVVLCDINGTPIASDICSFYASFSGVTSKNHVYGYMARRIASDRVTPTSEYSPIKYFNTASCKLKMSKGKKVIFKTPKIAGVKKYTIYMSKKSSSGFKKVKTIKAGKKFVLSKFKKKAFKYYQNYYYVVRAKLANGQTAEYTTLRPYFWIRRVYK